VNSLHKHIPLYTLIATIVMGLIQAAPNYNRDNQAYFGKQLSAQIKSRVAFPELRLDGGKLNLQHNAGNEELANAFVTILEIENVGNSLISMRPGKDSISLEVSSTEIVSAIVKFKKDRGRQPTVVVKDYKRLELEMVDIHKGDGFEVTLITRGGVPDIRVNGHVADVPDLPYDLAMSVPLSHFTSQYPGWMHRLLGVTLWAFGFSLVRTIFFSPAASKYVYEYAALLFLLLISTVFIWLFPAAYHASTSIWEIYLWLIGGGSLGWLLSWWSDKRASNASP
jgi:hypothetical protein